MLKLPRTVILVIWATFCATVIGGAAQSSSGAHLEVEHAPSDPYNRESQLMHSSLLYGLLSEIMLPKISAVDTDINNCHRDVAIILDGIERRSVWALKILDASGNVPSSFVFGNNFWFPSSALCSQLNEPVHISLSSAIPKKMRADLLNSTSPVHLKHLMVYANFTSPMQVDVKFHVNPIIHIGLCIPTSCPADAILGFTQSYLKRQQIPMQELLQIDMTVIATKSLDYDMKLVSSTSFHLLCVLVAFTVVATFAARLADKKKPPPDLTNDTKHEAVSPVTKAKTSQATPDTSSATTRALKCFNFSDNMRSIFRHSPSKGLSCISGIRTIACLWVLTFHVSYHSAFTISNIPQLTTKMEFFMYQPVFQAYLYVDTFFVLSALLIVYNFLKNETKRQTICANSFWDNAKLFGKHIAHRYVRLTPVLIATMICSEVLYTYLENYSPFWVDESNDLDCRESWWQNLLYIQNFYKLNSICSSWTWYLACDMQYYLISLVLLFVYAQNSSRAKAMYVTLSVAAVAISFYFSYIYDLTYEIDVVEANSNILYTKPWIRMNPFLSGAAIGWILYKLNGKTINIGRLTVALYWCGVVVLFLFTIFMTYKRDILTVLCATMLSLGKYIFGLFIGSIVLMCHLGYGGSFSKTMSNRLFSHMSKLTFSMYMVSPMVVTAAYGLKEVSTHFDETSTIINIIASITLSYFIAIVFAAFFELPFQKLSDEFVMKRLAKK